MRINHAPDTKPSIAKWIGLTTLIFLFPQNSLSVLSPLLKDTILQVHDKTTESFFQKPTRLPPEFFKNKNRRIFGNLMFHNKEKIIIAIT